MDTLYIGDIPNEYCYAVFSSDYVTLYNTNSFTTGSYDYYRIWFNSPGFFYTTGTTTINNNYSTITTQYVDVTDNFLYRSDISDIVVCSFVIVLGFIFCVNIFTSFFKSGGVLGGLL